MGPTAFRSTRTVAPGHLDVRVAESYFDAGRSLGPIEYTVTGPTFPNPPGYCTRFGLVASAEVALTDLSATYGITRNADVNVTLPLVLTNTRASEVFITNDPQLDAVVPAPCGQLDTLIEKKILTPITRRFSSIRVPGGKVSFGDGTNFGVGRISVGGKYTFYSVPQLQLAFAPEFFFPSPNRADFAGSDSAALAPRLLGQFALTDHWRIHADVGYDYDFDENELRRFAWNSGTSLSFNVSTRPATVDFGVGGSRFNQGIAWTPRRTDLVDDTGAPIASFQTSRNNTLGDTFVDFLAGIKMAVTDSIVVSGAVDVPLNGEGFRADAVGTIAVEFYHS